jgi:hypothetical protein
MMKAVNRPGSSALVAAVCLGLAQPAAGQQPATPQPNDVRQPQRQPLQQPNSATPPQKQSPPAPARPSAQAKTGDGQVTLLAFATEDGQKVEHGMVWHVFRQTGLSEARQARHIQSLRTASPTLKLPSGDYVVTASFGRAHVTRKIQVAADSQSTERFILNAGGLRLQAVQANGESVPPSAISIEILSEERDQAGNRVVVAPNVKPGVILRLNSGIYHLVSTFGDANAQVRADVTVEAGKLTEATITHHAARVTLKLVNRAGGEALADTQWSIATTQGIVVKESVGALPTHVLAPGAYTAIARSGGRVFRRDFNIRLGEAAQIELLAQ